MRKPRDTGRAAPPESREPAATLPESRRDRFSATADDVVWFGKMTLTPDPAVPPAAAEPAADAAPDEVDPAATPDPADRA